MTRPITFTLTLTALLCFGSATVLRTSAPQTRHDWREYRGHQGTPYSTLTQTNRTNVDTLEVAWTFDALPFAGTATPLTYEQNGRQSVVIAAGGPRVPPTGAVYVAVALRGGPRS